MSLVSAIKSAIGIEQRNNPMENPAVSLSSPALWGWLNNGEPTASGELVNDVTALQQSTVYSCVRVLSESVASLPLKLYERLARGRLEAVDEPLYRLLAVEPNSEMSAFTFWETFTGSLALTGNAYAQIQRNPAGDVVALWPLHPRQTEPIRLPDGSLAYRTADGMQQGQTRIIPAKDVLACPLFCFDGLRGLSPINQAKQAIGLARAAEKYGSRFFGNGSRPGGVLSTTASLDDKQQSLIRDSWTSAQGGENQGKTAFLYGDWSYQQIGLSPEESQFLATRQFQRAEIAALFRVPPHMVGDTTRLSNSNHEQQSLSFVTDTLRPYLSRIESEISRKLLPTDDSGKTYFVQFDVTERLRGDFATTMQGYAVGRQWGWFSANDVRRELGENPGGPELDTYLVPVNMADAANLLHSPANNTPPLNADEPDGNTIEG